MSNVVNMQIPVTGGRYFGPASVLDYDADTGEVQIALTGGVHADEVWAINAVPGYTEFSGNDEVLVMGETGGPLYVIGMLRAARQQARLPVEAGVYATVSGDAQGRTLQVFSAEDELLLEFEPGSDRVRLYTDSPHLEVQNRLGDMCFRTAGRMSLAARSIELDSRHAIRMEVGASSGKKNSRISLERNRVTLEGEEAGINAGQGDFRIAELCYTGTRFTGNVVQASIVARRLQSTVRTLVSRARNFYQKVDQLAQQKAGRVRALVEGTYHVKAENTIMKADKDYKVNAEKIHLG